MITGSMLLSLTLAALPHITAKFLEVEPGVHPLPHTGVDVAIDEGTKLTAVGKGIVEKVMDFGNTNVGQAVQIKLQDGSHVLYGHMSKIQVHEGQNIISGQVLGLSGNTGHSTGPHLHLQAYDPSGNLIDPTSLIDKAFKHTQGLGFVNPITAAADKLEHISDSIDSFFYWINPVHWVQHSWAWLHTNIASGSLDPYLLVMTIAVIWLTWLGFKKPKRWAFIIWIIFWILRGLVFA